MALADQPGPLSLPIPTLHPLRVLMRGAWVQIIRRNEFFVLLILLGLYATAALILRLVGNQSAHAARFVLGLGLQLGSVLSAVLVIVSAARALPPELENRTIYPVLAKPLSRAQLLLGKALPVWLIGSAALSLFVIASRLLAPALPFQQISVLLDAVCLKCCSLAMLTAITLTMSLYMAVSVNLLLSAALCFASGLLANSLLQTGFWRLISWLLPDFSLFEQFGRFTDGGARLGLGVFLGLICYASVWCALAGILASRRFARMAL